MCQLDSLSPGDVDTSSHPPHFLILSDDCLWFCMVTGVCHFSHFSQVLSSLRPGVIQGWILKVQRPATSSVWLVAGSRCFVSGGLKLLWVFIFWYVLLSVKLIYDWSWCIFLANVLPLSLSHPPNLLHAAADSSHVVSTSSSPPSFKILLSPSVRTPMLRPLYDFDATPYWLLHTTYLW